MNYPFLYIALMTIGLVTVIFLLAGNYFYNYAILRRKKEFLSTDPDLKHTTSGVGWQSNKEWLEQQNRQDITIDSHDGLKLNAIYLPASETSNKTVILVHGYSSWSGSMAGFAQYYNEDLGFNVLMPDLRGHGISQGNYIGFGWHDRKDILQWIDLILDKHGKDSQIVLHGISMGASTALMTSGEDLPTNVKCIISDCAYSSAEGILGYQMRRKFKLPKFPVIQFTSLICRLRAGYSFKEASALVQVELASAPILFIHGSEDRFVPVEMVYELYEATASAKELLVIEGATHGLSFWQDQEAYKAKMEELLERYM